MDNFDKGNSGSDNSVVPIEPKPKRSWKPIAIAIAVIGGLFAAAVVSVLLLAPSKLEIAAEECYLQNYPSVSLDEDGKGLYIDGQGEESAGLSVGNTFCILRALEMPSSVTSRIQNTTSLMGQQEAEWDGITALWTYHPDNGLDISLEIR